MKDAWEPDIVSDLRDEQKEEIFISSFYSIWKEIRDGWQREFQNILLYVINWVHFHTLKKTLKFSLQLLLAINLYLFEYSYYIVPRPYRSP